MFFFKKKAPEKKPEVIKVFNRPEISQEIRLQLAQYLDFTLTYVKNDGEIDFNPSYVYTCSLINCLKEANHPILNNILNRGIHWFMRNKVIKHDIFNCFKTLALIDFKHITIKNYLKTILPHLLKNYVNKKQEFHLQGSDGYLPAYMKEEEEAAITGAAVLIKYHENDLLEDKYFDENNQSLLLPIAKNSLDYAKNKILERRIHRNYYANSSFFVATAIAYQNLTGEQIYQNDIRILIQELNRGHNQQFLWNEDLVQSAIVFNNLIKIDNTIEDNFLVVNTIDQFLDNLPTNYNFNDLLKNNLIQSVFLMLVTLSKGVYRTLGNDEINEIVFSLKNKKFKI